MYGVFIMTKRTRSTVADRRTYLILKLNNAMTGLSSPVLGSCQYICIWEQHRLRSTKGIRNIACAVQSLPSVESEKIYSIQFTINHAKLKTKAKNDDDDDDDRNTFYEICERKINKIKEKQGD